MRKAKSTAGKRQIQDEMCVCGHLRSEHDDRFAAGHGACRAARAFGEKNLCKCAQFTWKSFVFAK